jgi:hypothetical protein
MDYFSTLRSKISLAFFLLLPFAGIAQQSIWSVGVLGSYGHYKFEPAERQMGQYQLHVYGISPSDMWRLGVFARKSLGNPEGAWFAQAELYRAGRGAYAQFENLAPAGNSLDFTILTATPTMRRYEAASLVGVKLFHSPVRILSGPVLSYMPRRAFLKDNNYSHTLKYPQDSYRRIEGALYEGFSRFTLNYQLGAGVEFWRLSLDLRREWSLTPVVSNVHYEGQSYRANLKGNLWMLTVGVRVWDKK